MPANRATSVQPYFATGSPPTASLKDAATSASSPGRAAGAKSTTSISNPENTSATCARASSESLSGAMRERFDERLDHMAARLACHASVRSGDAISRDEV